MCENHEIRYVFRQKGLLYMIYFCTHELCEIFPFMRRAGFAQVKISSWINCTEVMETFVMYMK